MNLGLCLLLISLALGIAEYPELTNDGTVPIHMADQFKYAYRYLNIFCSELTM